MALLVGALLAFAVGLLATVVGLDRDRAFYPTVTIVIASYYALFAVVGASTHALVLESLVGAGFLTSCGSRFQVFPMGCCGGTGGTRDLRPRSRRCVCGGEF